MLAGFRPMNEKAKLELSVLGAAVLLGVLGDALLRTVPWGLNLLLWTAPLVVVLLVLGRWRREALTGGGRWLLVPVILFSVALMWRDSPALKMLNVLALLVTMSLVMLRAQGGRVRLAGLMEYILGSVIAGLSAALGLLPLLIGDAQWKRLLGGRASLRAMTVLRGLLFAIPLLL